MQKEVSNLIIQRLHCLGRSRAIRELVSQVSQRTHRFSFGDAILEGERLYLLHSRSQRVFPDEVLEPIVDRLRNKMDLR